MSCLLGGPWRMSVRMKNKGILAAKWLSGLMLAVAVVGCNSDSDSDRNVRSGPRAETEQGLVEGMSDRGMVAFKGIPYAAPPVGELRFAPPQPHAGWGDSVLEAKAFGNACLQPAQASFGETESAEDCLYLNVYTPDTRGSYPVMVWIHGGAFETGSGGGTYDPVRLVREGVVVVTINYRLGILGFLAHPAFAEEGEPGAYGDYGILDQQAALQWVQANIGNFGGDPNNVTLFGESAGGHSVLTHIVSPASTGLFHKAIVQSGSYQPEQMPQETAAVIAANFATAVGCEADTAACLRDMTASEMLQAQAAATAQGASFLPSLRPDILPSSIIAALNAGTFNAVPVLMGTNLDEWRLFVGLGILGGNDVTVENYVDQIQSTLRIDNNTAQALASAYPPRDYNGSAALALSALGTDAIFACNSPLLARNLSAREATYVYEFADREAPPIVPGPEGFDYGAAHAFEIAYVLASEQALAARGATTQQIALADAMADYWTSFAKYGDPNPTSGTRTFWPAFEEGNRSFLRLVPNAIGYAPIADFEDEHKCYLWNAPPVT